MPDNEGKTFSSGGLHEMSIHEKVAISIALPKRLFGSKGELVLVSDGEEQTIPRGESTGQEGDYLRFDLSVRLETTYDLYIAKGGQRKPIFLGADFSKEISQLSGQDSHDARVPTTSGMVVAPWTPSKSPTGSSTITDTHDPYGGENGP